MKVCLSCYKRMFFWDEVKAFYQARAWGGRLLGKKVGGEYNPNYACGMSRHVLTVEQHKFWEGLRSYPQGEMCEACLERKKTVRNNPYIGNPEMWAGFFKKKGRRKVWL